jgi:hypothetical protein
MHENPYAPQTNIPPQSVAPQPTIQIPPQTWQYNEAWQQAYNMHQRGIPAASIYDEMIKAGMNPQTAQQILNSIVHSKPNGVPSVESKKTGYIIGGFVLIAIGIGLLVITAANRRSTGFIYGFTPTIYGGYLLYKGFSNK